MSYELRYSVHDFIKKMMIVLVLFLLVSAGMLTFNFQPWQIMWMIAFSIYISLKWISFIDVSSTKPTSFWRSMSYLLLWVGMDAKSFLTSSQHIVVPRLREWFLSILKMIFGFGLIVLSIELLEQYPLLAGWIGMTGIVFALHFGLFHLLSIVWRSAGINASPIMNNPLLATSLSDFWGNRWNLAFRDLSHTYIFRPLVGKLNISITTIIVFVVSGIVHDIVISLPAKEGFGLPTAYFVIQGSGLLFERSQLSKRLGLRHGMIGKLFCLCVTLGPVFLLFHSSFIKRVIVPMLTFIKTSGVESWI